MSFESGGFSNKLGNSYESTWVAYQLLRLLEEKILYVIVEPVGKNEVGADVIIKNKNDRIEFHQCKSGNANAEHWSLLQLSGLGVLNKANYQIQRERNIFKIVSPLTFKNLSDLRTSALNSSGNAIDFYNNQARQSKKREKLFNDLCKKLKLDYSKDKDLEKALFFLKNFEIVQYVINSHTDDELIDKSQALFSDNPGKVLSYLRDYPVKNNLRKKITANLLIKDLNRDGFNLRTRPNDDRVKTALDNISSNFVESIEPYLISKKLIKRSETELVLNSLKNKPIVLIKASAGIGKSTFLLEIHRKLMSQDVISVPIRLDRIDIKSNVDDFGKKLGFPYSPALCLQKFEPEGRIVIILDQLDAIRWTASHSSISLQVCRDLMRQILNLRKDGLDISVVIASRNFDIEDDIALKNWVDSFKDDISEIRLSNLEEHEVSKLIKKFENYSSLLDEKKKILTISLWLSIYIEIAEKIKGPPKFTNKIELIKNF